MSWILVVAEKMVESCYNRDQTWLCVYCCCQTPLGVVSPRGETTPSGVWHQQFTHNLVWSLKYNAKGENKELKWYIYIYYRIYNCISYGWFNVRKFSFMILGAGIWSIILCYNKSTKAPSLSSFKHGLYHYLTADKSIDRLLKCLFHTYLRCGNTYASNQIHLTVNIVKHDKKSLFPTPQKFSRHQTIYHKMLSRILGVMWQR